MRNYQAGLRRLPEENLLFRVRLLVWDFVSEGGL
jgi:hypothetical protein